VTVVQDIKRGEFSFEFRACFVPFCGIPGGDGRMQSWRLRSLSFGDIQNEPSSPFLTTKDCVSPTSKLRKFMPRYPLCSFIFDSCILGCAPP
jgi:hypothetical protein